MKCTQEQFGKKVFLEACKTDLYYRITKETILKYEMKDEFPEVFELQKDFTGWCKTRYRGNEKHLVYFENGILQYGFDGDDKWFNKGVYESFVENHHFEATEEAIFEALKNEAVKRGYKAGLRITPLFYDGSDYYPDTNKIDNKLTFYYYDNELSVNGGCGEYRIFSAGKWAAIIPIITKEEAEKRLGVKIE